MMCGRVLLRGACGLGQTRGHDNPAISTKPSAVLRVRAEERLCTDGRVFNQARRFYILADW